MNRIISKYLFYYPVTFCKGEWVAKYLREYEENQFLDRAEIEALQLFHLKRILLYAYNNCLFYKELYGRDNALHKIKSLADLAHLPAITKQDLIHHQINMSSGLNKIRVSTKTTGGSSGHPVTVLKNVDALARERAATWRSYAWAGVSVGDPQARFWGVPLRAKSRLKYKIVDLVANRVRLSAFDITEDSLKRYYYEIKRFKPFYLYGYVSMIERFSQYMGDNGLSLPDCVKSIITTSEILTGQVRARIESNLKRKVFNEYGCGEVGSIAHECSNGKMHIMADNLIVEVDGDGEIIVTDLHNYAMPLIRYRLKDFGKISYNGCECGCHFPVLENIYGRAYDMIKLPDGKIAHPEIVMYVFEELKEQFDNLLQFQFVQQSINNAVVNLVIRDYSSKAIKGKMEKRLKSRLEDVLGSQLNIICNYKNEITREPSGKIRLVKCNPGIMDGH